MAQAVFELSILSPQPSKQLGFQMCAPPLAVIGPFLGDMLGHGGDGGLPCLLCGERKRANPPFFPLVGSSHVTPFSTAWALGGLSPAVSGTIVLGSARAACCWAVPMLGCAAAAAAAARCSPTENRGHFGRG